MAKILILNGPNLNMLGTRQPEIYGHINLKEIESGYSHTSVAIRDSLALFSGMIIEVHISNIYGREDFRHTSMISSISNGVIVGLGAQSYNLAMRALAESFLIE